MNPRRIQLSLLPALLLTLAGLSVAGPAPAHPADEAAVYHYLWVEARPGELSLQYAAQVGGLLTQAVWPDIDRDGDGELATAEQERHARSLMTALPLRVDGRRVPWKLEEALYPTREQFFLASFPEGAVRLTLTAPLPRERDARLLAGIGDETFDLFTGIFPQPVVRGDGLEVGVPLVSGNGRLTEFRLGRGAADGGGKGTGSAEPPPAPPASGSAPAAGEPGTARRDGDPLAGIDPDRAPLFPDGLRVAVPPRPHEDDHAEGLKGFLGKPLSLPLILLGLGAAFVAGAAHALQPGHGKTMVAAYLVGARGTVRDAILLGLVVTLTHTSSVYLLGFLCLWLTSRIRAEVVGAWLNVVSGLLVLGMGFWLFQRGLLAYHGLRPLEGHTHGDGGHSHGGHVHGNHGSPVHMGGHGHSHGHTHAHAGAGAAVAEAGAAPPPEARRPPRDSPLEEAEPSVPAARPNREGVLGVISLGVAGGLMPCTDGLAILIAAVNLGSVAAGLLLIAAFSLGLAAVLVVLGILMVKGRDLAQRFSGEQRWVRALPAVSGGFLLILGAWLSLQSLAQAGVLRIGP